MSNEAELIKSVRGILERHMLHAPDEEWQAIEVLCNTMSEAYETQRSTIEGMKAALEPFAKAADWFNENAHDDEWSIYARNGRVYLNVGNLRRARAITHAGRNRGCASANL